MASTAYSICLSYDKKAVPCIELLTKDKGKLLRRWKRNRQGLLKMNLWSNTVYSKIIQQTRPYKTYFQLKSRDSHFILGEKENSSSACTVNTGGHCPEHWRQMEIVAVAGVLALLLFVIPSANAADAVKTYSCLLKECWVEMAKCIANPSCAANIACIETCNNQPDEIECEIKCGDLFQNSVVDDFNNCAVSRKKCIQQKSDIGEFPVPDSATLVKNFNIGDFNGKWYISSGLNPIFDTFDCQFQEFHTESDKLIANLSWRISTPGGGFLTRSTKQKFVQDQLQPGILYNYDNEYLNYQDDWYILSSKIENNQDDYVFVYYRGRNDAWDGYGGGVVYTRSTVLPDSIVPELESAAKNVGLDFNKFIKTDNTCGPEPPLVERLKSPWKK